MPYTLEVCVDSAASALAAKRGGADRLELCADLIIGGTTPSLALVRQVKAETGLPVRALLRPRFGDFCYDRYELAQMAETAAALVQAGADGIVTGVLTPEGELDVDALRPIYAAARAAAKAAGHPIVCTLHRAFDVCKDPFAALEAAKSSTPGKKTAALLTDMKWENQKNLAVITLEFDRPIIWSIDTQSGSKKNDIPNRMVVDLMGVNPASTIRPGIKVQGSSLRRMRLDIVRSR